MHKATNCIISCIDFRIQKSFYKWLDETHSLGVSDIIEVAGSTRDLARPLKPEDKEELLRNIRISVELHSPENIILIDHQDCGGYAQDNTIPSGLNSEEDKEQHTKYIKIAEEVIRNEFPKTIVKSYYLTLAGQVEAFTNRI